MLTTGDDSDRDPLEAELLALVFRLQKRKTWVPKVNEKSTSEGEGSGRSPSLEGCMARAHATPSSIVPPAQEERLGRGRSKGDVTAMMVESVPATVEDSSRRENTAVLSATFVQRTLGGPFRDSTATEEADAGGSGSRHTEGHMEHPNSSIESG